MRKFSIIINSIRVAGTVYSPVIALSQVNILDSSHYEDDYRVGKVSSARNSIGYNYKTSTKIQKICPLATANSVLTLHSEFESESISDLEDH